MIVRTGGHMKKDEKIKATIRMPKWLWQATQHRAIQEETTAESIVIRSLITELDIKPGEFKINVSFEKPRTSRKP
jgi:hypothetical protein